MDLFCFSKIIIILALPQEALKPHRVCLIEDVLNHFPHKVFSMSFTLSSNSRHFSFARDKKMIRSRPGPIQFDCQTGCIGECFVIYSNLVYTL